MTTFSPAIQTNGLKNKHHFRNVQIYHIAIMSLFQLLQYSFAQMPDSLKSNGSDSILRKAYNSSEALLMDSLNKKPATYPGGSAAFGLHLLRNLRMPENSRDNANATIAVTFTIEPSGKIKDFLASDAPKDLQKEAIRVIKTSGKWIPAYQDGKAVASQLTQKIRFKPSE